MSVLWYYFFLSSFALVLTANVLKQYKLTENNNSYIIQPFLLFSILIFPYLSFLCLFEICVEKPKEENIILIVVGIFPLLVISWLLAVLIRINCSDQLLGMLKTTKVQIILHIPIILAIIYLLIFLFCSHCVSAWEYIRAKT